MKFLITGANGDIAMSICRIIKDEFKNSVVEGTDLKNEGPGEHLFNSIHKVVKPKNKNYLKQIKKISKNHKIIIPTTENEIKFFSKFKSKFKNKKILINSNFIVNNFLSKIKTYNLLKKNKLGVPVFCVKLNKLKNFNKPFFIKTNYGHGNRNYKLIDTHKKFVELKELNKDDWIAQEYLDQNYDEYTCAVIRLRNFSDALILKRKLDRGYTYFAETINNQKLKNDLLNFAKNIDLIGSINIQLKINKARYAIFEINPRLSSTVMMRHKMGFKDCVWWLRFQLYKSLPKNRKKIKPSTMIKYVDEKFL